MTHMERDRLLCERLGISTESASLSVTGDGMVLLMSALQAKQHRWQLSSDSGGKVNAMVLLAGAEVAQHSNWEDNPATALAIATAKAFARQ